MSGWLVWRHLTQAQIDELSDAFDPFKCKQLLASFLKLDPPTKEGNTKERDSARADIVVDFYFYNYAFCKDLGLSPPKVSTFMSLMKEVLDADASTSSPTATLSSSYASFESQLLKHSVDRSPSSILVFSKDDVAAIVEHATNHYFRHFKLYKYIFTDHVRVQLRQVAPHGVEAPAKGKTLGEAVESGVVVKDVDGGEGGEMDV